MKGDFSRLTFDPANHFTSVLLQQGRVTVDADPNEQAAILLHYLRTLARDLIGPYAGPMDNLGFELQLVADGNGHDLSVGPGRYYVDGILCESEGCDYAQQPDYRPQGPDPTGQGGDPLLAQLANPDNERAFWIYLDVWERLVTWIEDDRIREVALGGADTSVRTQVVWQVKAKTTAQILQELQAQLQAVQQAIQNTNDAGWKAELQKRADQLTTDLQLLEKTPPPDAGGCAAPLETLSTLLLARMSARLDPGQQIKDPCVMSPSAAYRGTENQLYRIEIHQGLAPGVTPTFKWSRDNGSVVTRWLGTDGNDLLVPHTRGFEAGNWVELSHGALEIQGVGGVLVKLANVQNGRLSIDPDSVPANGSIAWTAQLLNPKVRRWDQSGNEDITLVAGAVPVVESGADELAWIDLEDGIQVEFAPGGQYRSGDYWLITARVATGTIDWLANDGVPVRKVPQGVTHHYAPLGFLSADDEELTLTDCRCSLFPTNTCLRARLVNQQAAAGGGVDARVGAQQTTRKVPKKVARKATKAAG
jgi:hypothetical protein